MKRKSIFIALSIFLLDFVVKQIVDKTMAYNVLKKIIPEVFYLNKVYNTGAAWSIFSNHTFILIIISLIAFVILLFYQKEFSDKISPYAFGLIYGGLFGNLLDRIRFGYVIDYFKVNIGSYEFPIFNIADISLVLGVILIIIVYPRKEHHEHSK